MLTSATKRKIDNARDILVGKIPMPTTQVEQITLALIYKFMSDIDKKSKALGDTSGFFANGYEKYAWDNLMDKSLPARDRVTLYSEGLEKMSKNPHIPQLFRDIFKNAFLPFRSPETLKLFLEQIDEFQYDHSEELGNAFEYLLSVMGSQGDAGQFRTPRHIIDFIVKVVDPSKTDTILDPACGTAGFLISAYKHIREKGLTAEEQKKLTDNFVGYDISHDMQRLAMVNMYLHHFPDPKIFEYDTLSSEDRWDDDFDVILANPPFMTPTGGIRPHNRFSVPSNRAEVLFVDYIMEHLTVNGKAGVIVPEGVIFQSQNAYKSLRKMMVGNDYLWAVVSLPSGVFQPYSGVKTSILLFDRQIAKKTNKILFVKVENDGFDLGAQRRVSKKNDLPVAQELLLKYKKSILNGKKLSVDEVLELGGSTGDKKLMSSYGFDLDANSHIELSQLINKAYSEVSKTDIKDEYVLSGERYKISKQNISGNFETLTLGDVCDILNGSTPSRSEESFWVDGTIPWFTIQDIRDQGRLIKSTREKITQKALTQTSTKLLPKDTVLLCCTASIGELAYSEIPLATNQQFNGLVIKNEYRDKLIPKFLFWISSTFKDELERISGKTSFGFVSVSNLKKITIPLPPVSLQKEIVEELDRYQKIIDGARQVVENYLPSFKIEDDWEWKKLEEFCDIKGGYAFKSNDFVDDGIQLIKMGNVKRDYFDYQNNTSYLPQDYVGKHLDYILSERDILISMTGTVGKDDYGNVCMVSGKDKYFLNQRVAKLQPNEKIVDHDYFYFCAISDWFKKQVIANSSGGVRQANVSANGIGKVSIPIPPMSVQKNIVEQIKTERKSIESLNTFNSIFKSKIQSRIDEIWGK